MIYAAIKKFDKKSQGARFVRTQGRRYKLRRSGNDTGYGGLEILEKEKISGKVVKVRRKSDRVMPIVSTLGKEVIRIICANGPQRRKTRHRKSSFL